MSEPPIQTGADHVHAHAHKTGHRAFDLIMAVSAIFISAISLFVAIEHGRTERDLVAANSWPFLREIRSNAGADGSFGIALGVSNGGVGPAEIMGFQLLYKGTAVTSPLDLMRRCCGLSADPAVVRQQLPGGLTFSLVDNTVLRAGENNIVVMLPHRPDNAAVAGKFSEALRDVGFRACYCSILHECWISSLRDTRTQPVKLCPALTPAFDPYGP